jgi:hypothetical protein
VTVPAGGALTYTLTPGKPARLLTQYAGGSANAPLIINEDAAGARLYLASDSSVSPANGVPVEPGTAIPWTEPGQIWAIADPAVAVNATVVITNAVGDWTPSPAAIAAQVLASGLAASIAVQTAQQIFALGVPNVLLEKAIARDVIAAASSKSYDISGYASLVIFMARNGGLTTDPVNVGLTQTATTSAGSVTTEQQTINSQTQATIEWVISGDTLSVLNNDGAHALNVTIVGSNRPMTSRLDARNNYAGIDHWSIATTAMVAGTTYPLAQATPFVQLQGQVFAELAISGTVVLGQFQVATNDGTFQTVAGTPEMYTTPGNVARRIHRMIALPATGYSITFQCLATGGNASASANLVQA